MTSVRKLKSCNSSCHTYLKYYLFTFLILNVPFFYSVSRPLDKANKSPGDKTTKTQKTENVINSDLILGLKRDLANKTYALTKGEGWKWLQTMRNTKSVAFPRFTCTLTHASRVAHLAVRDKGSTVVFLCGSGTGRKQKRKKEGAAAGGSGRSSSSATQTDHSGKNASLVLVCWAVTF